LLQNTQIIGNINDCRDQQNFVSLRGGIRMIDQLTVKSGKGTSHGNISELTAFFHIKPGHEEQLREACQRFVNGLRNAPPEVFLKPGLRDSGHRIFHGGPRIPWITAFETEGDPDIHDPIDIKGIQTWADWLQHTVEYPPELSPPPTPTSSAGCSLARFRRR